MNAFRDIIRVEIHSTADEIRRLKRWWRTPPDDRPELPATRFALLPSKRRATLLCMIMAHSRGRIHLRDSTTEEQEGKIIDELDMMDHMKRQTPLLAASLREAARAILTRRRQPVAVETDACVAPTEERRA
jgi:hypothetical protein